MSRLGTWGRRVRPFAGRVAARVGGSVLLAALLGCAGGARDQLPETASVASRLVLVSVAGLTAERISEDEMPTLAAMALAGAEARRVEGVAPAAERPAHATLVTGAPPSRHGIVAERRLGDRGVRGAGYDHASLLRAEPLWQRALEAGLPVASLDWPTTLGAAIPALLPDLPDSRGMSGSRGEESWLAQLEGETTAPMLEHVRDRGGDRPETGRPGAQRDAVIRGVACELLGGETPPRLLLMHLRQPGPLLLLHGPTAEPVRSAFRAVDRQLWELLVCLEWAGLLEETAVVVTGDHGVAEVHTEIAPNVTLAREGLIRADAGGIAWSAIARSNGGSAFVYARDEDAALRARVALGAAAERSGTFRVVSAEEMIRHGADPEAWFGIEASPGFAFRNAANGPLMAPATQRGVGGYLPNRPEMETALVGWGAGVRRGLHIPHMRQADVAPTFAPLLGLSFEGDGGRALVGVLTAASLRSLPAPPSGRGAPDGARTP